MSRKLAKSLKPMRLTKRAKLLLRVCVGLALAFGRHVLDAHAQAAQRGTGIGGAAILPDDRGARRGAGAARRRR